MCSLLKSAVSFLCFLLCNKALLPACFGRADSSRVMERWQREGYMCRHPELAVEPRAAPLQQRGVKYLAPGPFHGGC